MALCPDGDRLLRLTMNDHLASQIHEIFRLGPADLVGGVGYQVPFEPQVTSLDGGLTLDMVKDAMAQVRPPWHEFLNRVQIRASEFVADETEVILMDLEQAWRPMGGLPPDLKPWVLLMHPKLKGRLEATRPEDLSLGEFEALLAYHLKRQADLERAAKQRRTGGGFLNLDVTA